MFAENIEDVRVNVRRRCGDRISDSLTPKTLVNVKYKEQLKDIVDDLQAVRACRFTLLTLTHARCLFAYVRINVSVVANVMLASTDP